MAQRTCSIDGCERNWVSRGWCRRHYLRWLRHGDPLGGRTFEGDPFAHFESHVMTSTDECKIWPYYTDPNGYGELVVDGVKQNVHVLACIAWHGSRPEGMHAAHGPCHNPSCWNGAHVSWKSNLDNQRDKFRDGTDARGVNHPRTHLTEDDVRAIRDRRAAGESHQDLAREYEIAYGTVRKITSRQTWRHIA